MSGHAVFVDQSGRRGAWVKRLLAAVLLVTSVGLTVFFISLGVQAASAPQKLLQRADRHLLAADRTKASSVLTRLQSRLAKEVKPAATAPLRPDDRIVLGFYAPWEEAGLDSLRAHAESLTHLVPVWLHLAGDGASIDYSDFKIESNPNNKEVIAIARSKGLRLIPAVSNAQDGKFSRESLRRLLAKPALQAQIAQELVRWCTQQRFQGINLDFEEIADEDYGRMAGLLATFQTLFAAAHLELSVDVQSSVPSKVLAQWAEASDFLVLMAYDEHEESGSAGPIASIEWVEDQLENALKDVPENKVVQGIGNYAYDWVKGSSAAESVSFQEAMATAQGYRDDELPAAVVEFDADSFNSHFEYEDDSGKPHVVWMLDALSAFDQWKLGQERHLRGAALWSIGEEDPAVWRVLDRHRLYQKVNPKQLEDVHFPFEVTYTGQGEILKVVSRPQDGKRSISVDPSSGMIDEVEYTSYATSFLIRKQGFRPKKIVLTFDDGPDPEWTPRILDILAKYHVPATFFFVGANVQAYPDLARRAYDEGHEVGSHSYTHPNLGAVSEQRADLELSATQRVIEAIVGRSTILFRPPFNADSQPKSADEVRPVDLADRLGYITVGENIDPNDWAPEITNSDGSSRPRTADDIVRLILQDVEHRQGTGEEGNIVLLHDAGGNREQTVLALDRLIPELQKRGYELTSVAGLLGKSRADLMPPIPSNDEALVGIDRVVFFVIHDLQLILTWGFVLAILLGAGRVLLMAPLAWLHVRRSARRVFDPTFSASVSVLIAAFNEDRTIVGTLRSVLASDYPISEVLVIDDGSQDHTAAVVEEAFADDPRVRVIRKENGGKAAALNMGLEHCQGELLFCIDADTQLDPRAIGLLVRNFEDPEIGAVAGNVQVGNVNNILTAWQGVEYRTSQNLDRRAYALLNAITVVPGAIGMWRKDAVIKTGGYLTDTLAEDMDLTWRLRLAGYRNETEPAAIAYTEAPETWRSLFKQRFRWAYGTLQCLWKHRRALGRYGWFGRFALPTLWLFQIGFQVLGPLVDIQILIAAALILIPLVGSHSIEFSNSYQMESLRLMLELYAIFFCLELLSGILAYRMDRAKPWPLAWLFIQRFAYRQLMYLVMLRSMWRAITGVRQGWGKIARTGSVRVGP